MISNEIHYNLATSLSSYNPNEVEIKDTTKWSTFASYLDVLLKLDTNGKTTTQLYEKQDYFNFSIVNLILLTYAKWFVSFNLLDFHIHTGLDNGLSRIPNFD